MKDAEEALARVPFFADLSRRDLKRLAALCIPRDFEPGAEILREGGEGLGLFLISEGRVEVFHPEDGQRRKLAELGAGDLLGEMALIDDKPRSASAVALTPVSVLLLSRDSFRTVVKKSPDVAWAMVPGLAERLREVQDRLVHTEARAEKAEARAGEALSLRAAESRGEEQAEEETEQTPPSANRFAVRLVAAQYAFAMSAATGLAGSLRVCQGFLRELAEDSCLQESEEILPVLRRLPEGALAAAAAAIEEARKVPGEMVDTFLESLNGSTSEGDEE